MSSQNHTSIQHIIDDEDKKKKQSGQSTVSYGKEGEPIEVAPEKKTDPEMKFDEHEPQVEDQEVEKFVKVEKTPKFELDPKLKKAGLSEIDTTSLDEKYQVKLPIPDDKVVEGLKKPLSSSWRWLAEFSMYILHKGHLTLKKIHGHVVRIMMR